MPANGGNQGAWRIRTADRCLSTSYTYEELGDCDVYVYFIQAEDGPIKIGTTREPEARLRHFQAHNAHEVYFLGVFPSTARHERLLHSRLCRHRIRGEWYEPHDDVYDAIEACELVAEEAA